MCPGKVSSCTVQGFTDEGDNGYTCSQTIFLVDPKPSNIIVQSAVLKPVHSNSKSGLVALNLVLLPNIANNNRV